MFDFLKPKPKTKPEPTCYLFIGEQQCIGGFLTSDEAVDAARGDETVEYRITADMQGHDILFFYRCFVEKESCGCQWLRKGWYSVKWDALAYQDVNRIVFCGDTRTHLPVLGSGIGAGYILYTPWGGSARFVSFNNVFPSNGDPLQ